MKGERFMFNGWEVKKMKGGGLMVQFIRQFNCKSFELSIE